MSTDEHRGSEQRNPGQCENGAVTAGKMGERHFESAIPGHLKVRRSRPLNVGAASLPRNTSYSARFGVEVKQLVMGYFGVQCAEDNSAAQAAVKSIAGTFGLDAGPKHWDRATYTDEHGLLNIVFAAYWDSRASFERWFAGSDIAEWWSDPARLSDGIGYFREVFLPRSEGVETIFSHRSADAAACLAEGMSGEVMEHGYWGSARDRIPRSQVDELGTSGALRLAFDPSSDGRRVRVLPHRNLCVIRSGQDWSLTGTDERERYLNGLAPYLSAGMQFLTEHGKTIGCYSNRFVNVQDKEGAPTDRSYSVSLWRGISELEDWAASHPTHLAIYHSAIEHYSELGPDANLKLYHEVCVLLEDEQYFEYINCQPMTGLLGAVNVTVDDQGGS